MKILSIMGTRPDLIKMSELIKKLDKYTNHVFVHTNQNYDYELSGIFYKDLDLRQPDYNLVVKGESLGETLGNIIWETEQVLLEEKPDAVVILGDTNSALSAIIVKRLKIPLFHLEAGNRCFDDNVPEEINRRLIDHISDVNIVYTDIQRLYLLDEGIAKERLFISGSPMREILVKHYERIKGSTILDRLKLKPGEYFLVSLHREENIEDEKNFIELNKTLDAIAEKYNLPIIVSTHPRLITKEKSAKDKNVRFMKPFGFLDYSKLQINAKCVISDSGTVSEESAIIGFPAVTIRNAMERPEAIEAASIIMTGVNKENILKCLEVASKPINMPSDYATNEFSDCVLKIILGYTGYINRYVWHR